VAIQTSVFQMRAPFFTVNYLEDNFFENVDLSESYLVRVFFELFNFMYLE